MVSISAFESFNTGIRYQMYHAFLLFFIGGTTQLKSSQKSILFKLISTGLLLFSGSIYLLSTNDLTSFNFKVIGLITPVGGLFLIASWMLLFTYFFRISDGFLCNLFGKSQCFFNIFVFNKRKSHYC